MHACLDKFRLGRGGIRTSVAEQVYTLSKGESYVTLLGHKR